MRGPPSTLLRSLSFLSLFLFLTGCRVYQIHKFDRPCVEIPDSFLIHPKEQQGNISKWWREFQQPQLNRVVEEALKSNLDIKQAWSRLLQAKATACVVNSYRYPDIDLETVGQYRHDIDHLSLTNEDYMTYLVAPMLSYEIDLWRRIDSKSRAANLSYCSSAEDLEATALIIAGRATNLWFIIQEQKSLLDLINHQVEVSQTLLDLVELRFSVGLSSALDIYQQRLQLEDTKAAAIPVEATLKNAMHQLSILLGKPPQEHFEALFGINEIKLPPFPYLGTPGELLVRRPDLRAAHYSVKSADYDVAAAIADLFPRMTVPTSWELSTREWGDFFQQEIFRVAGRLLQPIIDGGRRRCEVQRNKAVVKERVEFFGQRFLDALGEVEDAIVNEKSQTDLISQIEKEIEIARANLNESRVRNANGLNDYLTVIAAIQSLQGLERQLIVEHRRLLTNRSTLYRALGGPCLLGCQTREEKSCDLEAKGEG